MEKIKTLISTNFSISSDKNKIAKVKQNIHCNICRDVINKDKPDSTSYAHLACGHTYCIDCLSDWILFKKNTIKQKFQIECPYCKKNSKMLELKEGEKYIKHLHHPTFDPSSKVKITICCAITKKCNPCKNRAKDGKYCGVHKNYISPD